MTKYSAHTNIYMFMYTPHRRTGSNSSSNLFILIYSGCLPNEKRRQHTHTQAQEPTIPPHIQRVGHERSEMVKYVRRPRVIMMKLKNERNNIRTEWMIPSICSASNIMQMDTVYIFCMNEHSISASCTTKILSFRHMIDLWMRAAHITTHRMPYWDYSIEPLDTQSTHSHQSRMGMIRLGALTEWNTVLALPFATSTQRNHVMCTLTVCSILLFELCPLTLLIYR